MTNNVSIFLNIVIEGDLDLAVLQKIIHKSKRPYCILQTYGKRGFTFIDQKIKAFNNASHGTPFLILRDLDTWECAPLLIQKILPFPKHNNLLFRIAVKGVETWLLADREGFSNYLGIRRNDIPSDVESIDNPKKFLINLARRSKRKIKEDIVPSIGSTARQGRGYNSQLIYFVKNKWNIYNAMINSDSLNRTYKTIMYFKPLIYKNK